MSLYLQRLLERAAALPPPPVGANPLVVSGSPILTFDQRLASAEMADDFSILGATPDLPEEAMEAPASMPGLSRTRLPGEAAPRPAAAVEPRAEAPPPAAPAWPKFDRPDASLPELREAGESQEAAPLPPRRPSDPETVERAPRTELLRVEPDLPPAAPVSVEVEPETPPAAFRPRADPAPAPSETERGQAISKAAIPDPALPAENGLARARPDSPEARPLPAVAPAVQEAERPVPAPTPAEPGPAAEPVVAALPPLAPPPRGLLPGEVERMIDEAIAAERERGAARGPATARLQQAQVPGSQGEAPARRPATAAQASLIGSLESSRFRPMLFGVRRR